MVEAIVDREEKCVESEEKIRKRAEAVRLEMEAIMSREDTIRQGSIHYIENHIPPPLQKIIFCPPPWIKF